MLIDAVHRALKRKEENGWDKIYLAVDLHGVVLKSTYNEVIEAYSEAKIFLPRLSNSKSISLIAYTSIHSKDVSMVIDYLESLRITFDYINNNPEIDSNELSMFDEKFYFDLLLDDKAGFVPKDDWKLIYHELKGIL